jgi:hypothetical protein
VKGVACPDQPITFTRRLRDPLPIEYRDLPSAASNQAGAFQVPDGICHRWPLDTQHFGEQVLNDLRVSSSQSLMFITPFRNGTAVERNWVKVSPAP